MAVTDSRPESKPAHTPERWEWERVEEPGTVPVTTLRGPDVLCRYWDVGFDGKQHADLIAAAPETKRQRDVAVEALRAASAAMRRIGWADPQILADVDRAIAECEGG